MEELEALLVHQADLEVGEANPLEEVEAIDSMVEVELIESLVEAEAFD